MPAGPRPRRPCGPTRARKASGPRRRLRAPRVAFDRPDAAPEGPAANTAAPPADLVREALGLLKQLARDAAEIRDLLKRIETRDQTAVFAPPTHGN
jgi:hypothetical protein